MIYKIIGYFGKKNFGDDALLYSVTSLLRLKGVRDIYIDLPEKSYVFAQTKGLKPKVDLTERVDVDLYAGGTQDFFYFSREISFLAYIKKFLTKVFKLKSADKVVNAKKRAAWGVGVGPFEPNFIKEKEVALRYKSYDNLGVRDQASLNWCKEKSIPAYEMPDLCFSLPLLQQFREARPPNPSEIKKIYVVLRKWPYRNYGADYLKILKSSVLKLQGNRKFEVTLVSFSPGDDDIFSDINCQRLAWEPNGMTIPEFCHKLGQADVIVSSRFHGVVFSILLGIPFVAIDVERKLVEAQKKYNKAGVIFRPRNTNEKLEDSLDVLLDNYSEMSRAAKNYAEREYDFYQGESFDKKGRLA